MNLKKLGIGMNLKKLIGDIGKGVTKLEESRDKRRAKQIKKYKKKTELERAKGDYLKAKKKTEKMQETKWGF